uniref:Uncharacterized protein n=1 Tax=Chromera velia CCMP2878 TaxID=1169474 RepID=A0A0G4GSV1_9ALVE
MCGGAEAFGDSKCKEGALEKAFTFVASGVLGKVPGWDPPVSELQVGDECSLVSFPQALGGLPEIRGLFSQMITEIQKGRERETTLLVQMKEGEGREKAFHAQIKEGEGREKALHAQIKEGEGREKALHTQIKEGEGREKALHAQIKEGKGREKALHAQIKEGEGREKALHAQIKEGEGREKALHAQVKEGGERVRTLEVQNNGLNRDLPICVDQLESTRKEKEQAWTTCGSLQKTTRDEAERDAKGAIQILSCLCFCLLLPFLYIILNPISAQRSSRRGLPKLESTLPQKATIFPKQTLRLTLPATAPIIPIQRIPQTAKIPTHAPAANELLQDTNASVNTPPQPTPDPSVDAPAEPDPTPPVDAPAEAPPTPPVDAPAEAPPTPPVDAPAEAPPTPPVDAPAEAPPTPPVDAPAEAPPTPPVDAPAEAPPTPPVDAPLHAQIKEGEGREKALHAQIKEGEGREKALHAQIKEGEGREKALHAQIKEGEGREKALHAQVKEGGERVRTLEVQNNGLNRDLPICVDQLESTRKEKEQAWTTCGSLQKTTRDEAERDAKGAIQILSCLCFCLLLPFLYIILNPISAQRSSRRGLPKLESTLPQKATIFPKQTLRLTLPATAPIIPIQRIPQTAKIPTHAPAANELLQDTNASVNTPPQPTPTPPVDAPAEPTPTPPVDAPAEPTPTPSVDSAIQTHSRVCLPHALLYNLNFATFLITNLNPNLNKNQMMSKLKEWLCQWRVNNLSDIRARAVFGKFGIALLIPLIDRPGQREAISKLSNMTATWREWRLQRARDGHDVSTELQISAKGGRSAHDIEMAYEEILSPWRYSDDQLVSY